MSSRSWAKGVQRKPRAPGGADPSGGRDRASSWRTHAYRLLLPLSLTLLAYSNSFSGGLIYDSRVAIVEDPRVHAATSANVHAVLTQDTWSATLTSWNYRPLTNFSYLLNYSVLG